MLMLVDTRINNLTSVKNALTHLEIPFISTSDAQDISKSTHIIIPGVGAFGAGMHALKENHLIEPLRKHALELKKPLLGICLGIQLLFDSSEEAPGVEGLKILEGDVKKLSTHQDYSVPRMGWSESNVRKKFLGIDENSHTDFYHLHSFYVCPKDSRMISITTETNEIPVCVQQGNIYGCQFHPEKSHKAGLRILKSFASTQ
jgi:glutamine amidotransferase